MIKLIVSDIDGTLVNSKKEIPTDFWSLFQELKERSIGFCIASGRQIQGLQQLFAPIADDLIFIPDNGASLVSKGTLLYEDSVPFSLLTSIIKVCEKVNSVGIGLCGKKYTYIKTKDEGIFAQYLPYYPAHQRVETFENINDVFFKLAIYDKKDIRTNLYPLLAKFGQQLNIAISGKTWLDVMKKDTNKGNALAYLQKYLDVTVSETAVFGDHLNDLEMMRFAKYSFAMKNAEEEVKKVANYITDFDNENQGVTRQIRKFFESELI
ncbi:HAD family hydrolase [Capnocytophaga catalasegens]|nr:HAD family hydrolase [Capnocytophaga catalasegens]